jgi:hypothetical protein
MGMESSKALSALQSRRDYTALRHLPQSVHRMHERARRRRGSRFSGQVKMQNSKGKTSGSEK